MDKICIDRSNFPILILKVTEELNIKDVDNFEESFIQILDSTTERFVFISDQSSGKFMNGEVRIKLGKCIQKISEIYSEREAGVIIINNNIVGRMMIKGLHLLVSRNKDIKVVGSLDEAMKCAGLLLENESSKELL